MDATVEAVAAVAAIVQRRKRGARFADIAAEAGVSEATVDRVLNERGSVSAASRERVVAAARKLGLSRSLPDVRHGIVHFDVILPVNHSPMFGRLLLALDRVTQMLDRRIVVHRITLDHRDDAAFAKAVLGPPYRRSGLAVMGSTAPLTTAALREVIAAGEPVAVMVSELMAGPISGPMSTAISTSASGTSDIPTAGYVGIDNAVAGRTAGHSIGRLTRGEGRVLVLCAHHDYCAHAQRVAGCLEALADLHPGQVCMVAAVDTLDDPDRCYRAVCEALAEGPIAAIYNSGDGSRGVHEALRRFRVAADVVWVAHEMHDEHARYLEDGSLDLVIDQDPDGQVLAALQHLVLANGPGDRPALQNVGEFKLFTRPNARRQPYLA